MKVEIVGTLKEVQEVITFDSGFQKQTVIIETDSKYDKLIPLQLIKDNVGAMEGIAPGTRIKVAAYLGGREWNGKYFLDLKFAELLGVDRNLNQEAAPRVETAAAAPAPQKAVAPKPRQTHMEVDKGEDLPF